MAEHDNLSAARSIFAFHKHTPKKRLDTERSDSGFRVVSVYAKQVSGSGFPLRSPFRLVKPALAG
jgi:hypothetical protein